MVFMGKRLQKINCSSYNRELTERGSITFWICEESVSNWFINQLGQPLEDTFRSCDPDTFIVAMQVHLTLRVTQGFAGSVLKMMGLRLPIPNYSALSRRAKKLKIELSKKNLK